MAEPQGQQGAAPVPVCVHVQCPWREVPSHSTLDHRIRAAKEPWLPCEEQPPPPVQLVILQSLGPLCHMLNLFQVDSAASVCPQNLLSLEEMERCPAEALGLAAELMGLLSG